jgi:outer membrane lipoprotein SlyB
MKMLAMLLLVTASACFAASEREWNLTLTNGDHYADVVLERVSNDTLYFRHKSNYLDRVEIDSLAQLVRFRRSAILPSSLIGGAGGGIIGYALKPASVEHGKGDVYSALFGVVVGGVAGFFIGDAIQSDEVFEMQRVSRAQRIELLTRLAK